MSPAERTMLRTLIDRARRAQLDQHGGYDTVEHDARCQDRRVGPKWGRVRLDREFHERPEVGFYRSATL